MLLKQSWVSRGTSLLFLYVCLANKCFTQTYPVWFINQGTVSCEHLSVGYSKPFFNKDSAAAQAFRDACFNFNRDKHVTISGGQAFWSTEYGTSWMGSNLKEQIDSSTLTYSLTPLDTFYTNKLVIVLVGVYPCLLKREERISQVISKMKHPDWVNVLPSDDKYYYSVGITSEYFYEISSWIEAEKIARLNLASQVISKLKSIQKTVDQKSQEIRDEKIYVNLKDVKIVSRWRDLPKNLFYVLIRMGK